MDLNGIVSFLKLLFSIPANVVTFVILCCALTIACTQLLAESVYAEKQDMETKFSSVNTELSALKNEIMSVGSMLDEFSTHADIVARQKTMADLESEIYQLSRLVDANEANERDLIRLDNLRSQLNAEERDFKLLYGD